MVISTIPDRPAKTTPANSQLFQELDRHRRPNPWRWCGCLFFLLIIAVIGGVLWLVAASGIISVPGVSAFAFPARPTPARVVTPKPFDAASLQSGSKLAADGSGGTVVVTEAQLTSLVGADHFPQFRQAQVTVDPDGLRIFGLYVNQPFQSHPIAISAHVVPATTAHPACTVDELKVGYLPLPASLIKSIVHKNCQSISSILTLAGSGQTNQVEFGQGQLTLHLAGPVTPATK